MDFDTALTARDHARADHDALARRLGCRGSIRARLGLHLTDEQRQELLASAKRLREAEAALLASD